MSLGRRQEQQKSMWLLYDQLPQSQGQGFYERLQKLLYEEEFDRFLEKLCAPFYAEKSGRRFIPPGRSFHKFLTGCFEGIDTVRSICWCSSRFPVLAGDSRTCTKRYRARPLLPGPHPGAPAAGAVPRDVCLFVADFGKSQFVSWQISGD